MRNWKNGKETDPRGVNVNLDIMFVFLRVL